MCTRVHCLLGRASPSRARCATCSCNRDRTAWRTAARPLWEAYRFSSFSFEFLCILRSRQSWKCIGLVILRLWIFLYLILFQRKKCIKHWIMLLEIIACYFPSSPFHHIPSVCMCIHTHHPHIRCWINLLSLLLQRLLDITALMDTRTSYY